jgi:hypothetical protein
MTIGSNVISLLDAWMLVLRPSDSRPYNPEFTVYRALGMYPELEATRVVD